MTEQTPVLPPNARHTDLRQRIADTIDQLYDTGAIYTINDAERDAIAAELLPLFATKQETGRCDGLRTAQATLTAVRAQAADWAQLAAPGDVGTTPDDTALAGAGHIILGILGAPQPAEDPWPVISRLTAWLDTHNGRSSTETALRILKVTEEAGEVAQAWIGAAGQNPRKGVSHTTGDVADELCDVITAAMVALTTITTDPASHFTRKVAQIAAVRLDDMPTPEQRPAPMDPVHILGIKADTPDADRQARRGALIDLITRIGRGRTGADIATLLTGYLTAEQADGDRAREQLAAERDAHEGHRLDLAAVLKWDEACPWDDLITSASATERDATRAEKRVTALRAALADVLAVGPDLSDDDLIACVRDILGQRDQAREQLAEADRVAQRTATRHGGHHHALADALGWDHTIEWAKLVSEVGQRTRDLGAAEREAENERKRTGSAIRRADAAEATVRDYENRITWETTCAGCARVLDACRAADERAEKAEAERDEARRALNLWIRAAGQERERAERAEATLTAVCKAVADAREHGETWGALDHRCGTDHLTEIEAALADPQPAPVDTLSSRLRRMLGTEQGTSDDSLIEAVRGLLVQDARRDQQPATTPEQPHTLTGRPISKAVNTGQETRMVRISVTSPTAADADVWAQSVADLVVSNFGQEMRLHVTVDGRPIGVEGEQR